MEIIEKSSKTVDVRLSIDELNIFRNALNEACNAIYVSEFKTRRSCCKVYRYQDDDSDSANSDILPGRSYKRSEGRPLALTTGDCPR